MPLADAIQGDKFALGRQLTNSSRGGAGLSQRRLCRLLWIQAFLGLSSNQATSGKQLIEPSLLITSTMTNQAWFHFFLFVNTDPTLFAFVLAPLLATEPAVVTRCAKSCFADDQLPVRAAALFADFITGDF